MCIRLDEYGGHIFLKCKQVKQVWRALLIEDIRLNLLQTNNPMAMFDQVWALDSELRELVLIMMWEWWNVRNKANAGERTRTCEEIYFTVRKLVTEFATLGSNDGVQVVTPEPASWSRPEEGFVKINIDAAFHEVVGRGAWGCVARSDQGEVIFACAGKLDYLASPLQAEATACIKAIEATSKLGIH